MTTAHWIINVFIATCVLIALIKAARDPDWSAQPGVMAISITLTLGVYASVVWALHQIGAFPWVAP